MKSVEGRIPADPNAASPEQIAAFMRYLLEMYVMAARLYGRKRFAK